MTRMRHSIMVSDQTWRDYGGSPAAMREVLIRHAIRRDEAPHELFEMASSPFTTQFDSVCRLGGERIAKGTRARYVYVAGEKQLVCEEHYSEVAK